MVILRLLGVRLASNTRVRLNLVDVTFAQLLELGQFYRRGGAARFVKDVAQGSGVFNRRGAALAHVGEHSMRCVSDEDDAASDPRREWIQVFELP